MPYSFYTIRHLDDITILAIFHTSNDTFSFIPFCLLSLHEVKSQSILITINHILTTFCLRFYKILNCLLNHLGFCGDDTLFPKKHTSHTYFCLSTMFNLANTTNHHFLYLRFFAYFSFFIYFFVYWVVFSSHHL